MFERDYLVRMLVDLAAAIRRSMDRARGEKDLAGAIEILDSSISSATDLDGSVLLTLSPDSIASVLQVANTDPRVCIYIGHSMQLQAYYLRKIGNIELADLRDAQAMALASAYGFELSDNIEDVENEIFDEQAFLDSIEKMCNQ